ncbi:MAG: glutamine amidotransferase [Gammaproteobacteria bacterium]|nr:glutamine amidotransferase [Gammaproteobacteria bacterium]MDP2347379.1 glutamine amidotransferase [Gammaproteobacteria bacterium]
MKPLLIMKTGRTIETLRQHGEDFEDWIITAMEVPRGHTMTVAVDEGETLPSQTTIAGIVVTGSPAMITDGAPWNEIAADYLRSAISDSLPILGICYGHQLLAQACGGRVDYHPAGREVGTVQVRLHQAAQSDPLLAGLPREFRAHATHSQSVLTLPESAILLAGSDHDPHQSFRIAEWAWGVQFHPEFTPHVMRTYVLERQEALRAEGFDVEALLAAVVDTPAATAVLRNFARLTEQELR